MQYRIMRSVYNQVIAATANEMEKPAEERVHIDALNTLGENVLLELEAANRDGRSEARLREGSAERRITPHHAHAFHADERLIGDMQYNGTSALLVRFFTTRAPRTTTFKGSMWHPRQNPMQHPNKKTTSEARES
jgi:hypothetical protein